MHAHFNKHSQRHCVVGGRKKSDPRRKKLHFADFARRLPAPPESTNYSAAAASLLALMLGNADYGDCVFAAGYHIVALETSNADDPVLGDPTLTQWALADYSATTGFNPDDPSTDNGADPQTIYEYWTKTGFRNGTKLAGTVAVNAADPLDVGQAFALCENSNLAMGLPQAWVDGIGDLKPGDTWDVAGPSVDTNGHDVPVVDLDPKGVWIVTWGMRILLTWAALAKYGTVAGGGELDALLTPDQLIKAQAKAPNGMNWAALVAGFDSIGGNVPAPVPVPPPAPVPKPPLPPTPAPPAQGVTLAQAQAWATAPFKSPNHMVSEKNVVTAITTALAKAWPK